jgi:glycosyltransferase involved in cell wall biosynthesis
MSKLAIVPAYNEQSTVADVVGKLRVHAPDFDVLVVDDGSTDATSQRARESGAVVIRLPFNVGIGGAVQAGYKYALAHDYRVVVQIDGDGQHDPRYVHTLLNRLNAEPAVDMVTGSRFLDVDGDSDRSTPTRRMGIRLFALVLSAVTRRRVTDPTSGFRMTNRRAIELFATDYPHDYPEVEAVLLVHAHRLRAAEAPVCMRARTAGVSSINASQSVYYMVKVLLAVVVGLLRRRPAVEPGDEAPVVAERAI